MNTSEFTVGHQRVQTYDPEFIVYEPIPISQEMVRTEPRGKMIAKYATKLTNSIAPVPIVGELLDVNL